MKRNISFSTFEKLTVQEKANMMCEHCGKMHAEGACMDEGGKPGLWANIHKRRKAGKAPKKPGDKGYPKTLDIEATDAETPSMSKLDKPKVSTKDKNTLGKLAKMMSKEKSKKMLKGAKESYGDSITSPKMRALAKADSQPKKPVTLPKAPWEKGTNVTYDKNGRVIKEAAIPTMMVTRPGAPNEPIKISATEWPSFKARGYHHAEQKENLNLINKIKKSGVAKGSMGKDDDDAERKRAGNFQAGLDKVKADMKARQAARKANTDESVNEEDATEALDMKQRLARGRSARKNKAKMAMGRKKAGRRIASMTVLKKRARRAARKTMTKRLTKGIAKAELSVSRKREIEKRLDKPAFKTKVNRLVKRTLKDIRKKEIARKRK